MTTLAMMQIDKNLQAFNTMALSVNAAYYFPLQHINQLEELSVFLARSDTQSLPLHLLGGGSNIVFKGDVQGIIVHLLNKGVRCIKEDHEHVFLQVEAGEIWDDFVDYCVVKGYAGIENLSLIPGTVGAAPIQNIGAYGQEVGDTIERVNCVDVYSLKPQSFDKKECEFSYRMSRFKRQPQQGLLVESVVFKLSKVFTPNIGYQPLSAILKGQSPTLSLIRDSIISIRESKLPNPEILANTGSFFQNPVVSAEDFQRLIALDSQIPSYPQADGRVKLAAAYLIEQCGFKGQRYDDSCVGMHAKQALVLVNYGNATADQVLALASKVKAAVHQRFGVCLQQEPVII